MGSERFATFDLNGWLDHLVVGGDDVDCRQTNTLGFRSCLVRHGKTWLFGAQALAAAREQSRNGSDAKMVDAIEALATSAGYDGHSEVDPRALPTALWQSVANAAQRSNEPVHLALVVPDGRFLGRAKVEPDGRTRLESLHASLVKERPIEQVRSRVELIWRSVAALEAAIGQAPDALRGKIGRVMVISINRKIFWTMLELRRFPASKDDSGEICIARSHDTDECRSDEAWTAERLVQAEKDLAAGPRRLEALRKWTRAVEILASGMSSSSLREVGIHDDAIEQWTWPIGGGDWQRFAPPPLRSDWPAPELPGRLERKLEQARNEDILAVVVECPTDLEMVSPFAKSVSEAAPGVPVVEVGGRQTAEAALDLALRLGRDARTPAWLDQVPKIEYEVRAPGPAGSTSWKSIIPDGEAIPAGETYVTDPRGDVVRLAPGVEHVHLHLRRGGVDERYSGKATGHGIDASDGQRFVEPVARVRPLSGETRVEIKERRGDGRWELLAGSQPSIKWSEMSESPPSELGSIPELYVFEAREEGWKDLEPLLKDVARVDKNRDIDVALKERLYKATQKRWQDQTFPLDSSGQPPRIPREDSGANMQRRHLLSDATRRLLAGLEEHVEGRDRPNRAYVANRLHLPLTWLFTGCPERVVEILIDAALGRGNAPNVLHGDAEYSAWSIYQGIGRAAKSKEALAAIFDELISLWDGTSQDKYLLAAVTHPLARRVAVREVLGERKKRFLRVMRFLRTQLENLLKGRSDPRVGGSSPRLELRYITMGYRGLCQLRYHHEDWFPIDGDDAKWARESLAYAVGRYVRYGDKYEKALVEKSVPYLTGDGEDPTMPGGF